MKQKVIAGYPCTEEYQNFLKKGSDRYREMIKKMKVDEDCEDLFDAEIDAVTDLMRIHAAEQYTSNLQKHHKNRRMEQAKLALKRAELRRLQGKLKDIECEIMKIREMKSGQESKMISEPASEGGNAE